MKIKIFLDTNILMDVLMEDRPLTAVSNKVFQTVLSNKTEGVLVAQSFVDASYMYLRKNPGGYDRYPDNDSGGVCGKDYRLLTRRARPAIVNRAFRRRIS